VIRAVFRKELAVTWTSPVPYVSGALFHATLGVLGHAQLASRGQAVFQPIVPIAGLLLVVVAPVLAARSFAEEARTGTLELLQAVPVSPVRLAAGKYAAVLVTLLGVLAPASLFAVVLALYGSPDLGPILAGLTGLALMAVAIAGVGVLASSLTSSQPVAAALGVFVVLALWFAHVGSEAVPTGSLSAAFSISERLRSFAGGAIELSDAVFFCSVGVVSAAASAAALEARRRR
jgi:ABC-2 type transport system permease protein